MDWSERRKYRKGSIIHTCSGYNKVIMKIECDGTVITDDGQHCDFEHCCEAPRSKEDIIQYFLKCWGTKAGKAAAVDLWGKTGGEVLAIVRRLEKGEDVFDEYGCLLGKAKKKKTEPKRPKRGKLKYESKPLHIP